MGMGQTQQEKLALYLPNGHPFTVRMKRDVSEGRDKKILSGKKCVGCRQREWRSP
jgi:hypothetical protein